MTARPGVLGQHLLLVEDDQVIAEMYRYRLELDGHEVTVASDGEAGLREARSLTPDLILLDIQLPRLNGFQVLEALQASPETTRIPVIVLSNSAGPGDAVRCRELGAVEYLLKSATTPSAAAAHVPIWASKRHAKLGIRS